MTNKGIVKDTVEATLEVISNVLEDNIKERRKYFAKYRAQAIDEFDFVARNSIANAVDNEFIKIESILEAFKKELRK